MGGVHINFPSTCPCSGSEQSIDEGESDQECRLLQKFVFVEKIEEGMQKGAHID